jgi:hypothetical protein
MQIVDSKGVVLQDGPLTFPTTPRKLKWLNTTTGSQINAGTYRLVLSNVKGVVFDELEIQ